MRLRLLLLSIISCLSANLRAEDPKPDPASLYKAEVLEGYTLLVHPEVEKHPDQAKLMRTEMASQLRKIKEVVPEKAVTELKKVRIWVEWQKKPGGAAEFHPSAKWLKDNGYNPEKAGCVEINNCKNFVEWSKKTQPWMVLHELAHAYHFRVLGEGNATIQAAYKQAMERKLYDSVEFIHGGKRKAYATTNNKEYFAEVSEAFFGKNDFFPFNREEFKKHDPVGYEALCKVWGVSEK
jgi:hypothetical protein